MSFDTRLVAAKLRRWEKFLDQYHLPDWDSIPNFGLYMEQVITLLKEYLDYLPPELKEEQFITAATINNYVRTKIMPGPVKKKYYRIQIAYLLMILSLKQSLSISMIHRLIPMDLSEEEVRGIYEAYAARHRIACKYFTDQVRLIAAPILDHVPETDIVTETPVDLITTTSMIGGLACLMAEKLLLLEDLTLEDVSKDLL